MSVHETVGDKLLADWTGKLVAAAVHGARGNLQGNQQVLVVLQAES